MRLLALCALLAALPAAAQDEVVLKSGEKVVGTIKGMKGGKLAVDSPQLGSLKIAADQIASLKSDQVFKFTLATGETIEGRISSFDAGKARVESAGAGPVDVELAKVKVVNEPPVEWHGFVDIGGRTTDGNTHNAAFTAAFEASRVSDVDEILVRALFRYGEDSDRVIIERNSYGLAKYSYRFSDRFYGFASAEFYSDRFKDLTLRTILSGGIGYKLVTEPWADLSLEAGVAYIDNNFRVSDDEGHAGGRLAAHARIALPLGFELVDDFVFYPNFEESQDFQIHNELAVSRGIGGGWTMRAGVITDYDREPTLGTHRHDDTYFVSVGYKF
jgi:putative salt-induced outer membrane protein YdiY